MSADRADALIRALGHAVGIDALALDDGGTCTLRFDETVLTFELDEGEDRLVLHAAVGPLPAEGQAELLARLLEGNLFWKDTHGATLALDRREDRVLLLRAVPLDSPSAGFPGLVERFVDAAEAWREVIAKARGAVPEPAATATFIDPTRFA
jgi:Tir chaperone protein (CesT) family